MSWQCTEGPGGYYPGERGYEESLTQNSIRNFERKVDYDSSSAESQMIRMIEELGNKTIPWIRTSYDPSYINVVKYLEEKLNYTHIDIHENTIISQIRLEPSKYNVATSNEGHIVKLDTISKNTKCVIVIDKKFRSDNTMNITDIPHEVVQSIFMNSKHCVVFSSAEPGDHPAYLPFRDILTIVE